VVGGHPGADRRAGILLSMGLSTLPKRAMRVGIACTLRMGVRTTHMIGHMVTKLSTRVSSLSSFCVASLYSIFSVSHNLDITITS
jgi:hypothetical protein